MIRQTRFYLSLLIAGAAYWGVKTFTNRPELLLQARWF